MQFIHRTFVVPTQDNVQVLDLTPQIQAWIEAEAIRQGQITLIGQHTTTALIVNECEDRLWADIRVFLQKLAPAGDRYLHNDLHLRDVPEDEPINAHSHLMAMLLDTSVTIPIIDGGLGLGTYQSVLMLELDGPRTRTVLGQILGV
ncbi:MAG: secondary thiamine-phosphate synthase enzyme YjbQ [Thermosynechococcaceae cyanobacterium]